MTADSPIDSPVSEESPKTKKTSLNCTLQAKRNYYQRHREKILARHKEWREENKEHLKELQKKSSAKYAQKKKLELQLIQKLAESQTEEDEEDDFFNRLGEVITIANFYERLGIHRPIDFYEN
jgi:cell division septum initiation protein DivIVA